MAQAKRGAVERENGKAGYLGRVKRNGYLGRHRRDEGGVGVLQMYKGVGQGDQSDESGINLAVRARRGASRGPLLGCESWGWCHGGVRALKVWMMTEGLMRNFDVCE